MTKITVHLVDNWIIVESMELVSLHATVNIVRRMLQATALLLVAAAFNIMLKVAFNNNSVESSTNRMQHVAVLPQWNTALTHPAVEGSLLTLSRDAFFVGLDYPFLAWRIDKVPRAVLPLLLLLLLIVSPVAVPEVSPDIPGVRFAETVACFPWAAGSPSLWRGKLHRVMQFTAVICHKL